MMTNVEHIQEQLRKLRLKDMASHLEAELESAQKERKGYQQFLEDLLARQLSAAEERSVQHRILKANLPRGMSFDNFDWAFQPSLNIELVKDLCTFGFIQNRNPVMILGRSGTGKTHIATALGIKACEAGYRVKFFTLQKILSTLYATLADNSTDELIAKLGRLDLMIIDQVGYIRTKSDYPSLFLDLVCTCQNRVSIIVTSNISLDEWGVAIGAPTLISAIIDRLLHKSSIINILNGRNYCIEGPYAPKITSVG